MIFKDGVEETMKNASCYVILFHEGSWLHFTKSHVSQIPYLYSRASSIWASKYPTMHMSANKTVTFMAPISDYK